MKSNMLRKSGLCLLVAAGAMVPIASTAEDGSKYGNQASGTAMQSDQGYTYRVVIGEGTLYDDLQRVQSSKGWMTSDRGAQGPIRTDKMEFSSSAGEGTLYQDLQKLQSSQSFASNERGAQGPIRSETMGSSSAPAISDLYDGRKIYK
ncbi:MAG TPA: hypothetical protein VN639_05975 [Azonexus sp.]|nr:hypothetical protein [Azonexus sp.]